MGTMGRLISRKVIMRKCRLLIILAVFLIAHSIHGAPEDEDEEELERALCKDKGAGEWFRLEQGDDKCRDVIQCTASGLQAIRCPAGLAFDIEKQTCNWKASVGNCDMKTRERKVKPLLFTDEPLCQENFLACGDGNCIERGPFCNGEKDCNDGSDENACDIDSDPNRAPPCDTTICKLPDCFCSEDGTQVPGNLCKVGPAGSNCQNVPQMITVTFDDAINNNNIDLYREIFNRERKNPNGCDVKASFFVSHKYTNYSSVQEMHYMGHEIAAHSITHNDDELFWTGASVDDWAKEMAGSRLIIDKFANITDNSVVGLRAPYLRVGGNSQFTMMEEQAFLYDSSITAPLQNPPLWPYTMYFKMPHRCHGNLHHHDPSHPVDPEPCVRRLRQELCSMAGEVLPWSTNKLFGAKQLQTFNRRAWWGVDPDAHVHEVPQQVPLAQRPHRGRHLVIISFSSEGWSAKPPLKKLSQLLVPRLHSNWHQNANGILSFL